MTYVWYTAHNTYMYTTINNRKTCRTATQKAYYIMCDNAQRPTSYGAKNSLSCRLIIMYKYSVYQRSYTICTVIFGPFDIPILRVHSGVRETPQIDHMVSDTVIEGFYTGNTLFLRAHNSAHPRTTILFNVIYIRIQMHIIIGFRDLSPHKPKRIKSVSVMCTRRI